MREEAIKKALMESNYTVAVCGTGMLREMGVYSLRDESRAYDIEQKYGNSPEEIFTSAFYSTRPEKFFDFYKNELLSEERDPGDAFYSLARLEEKGKLDSIITNNVFGYPQKAGCDNVIELHGNVENNVCINCGARYGKDYILNSKGVPRCEHCGYQVRPKLVFYGEAINNSIMTAASTEIARAELLLVLGTNLRSAPTDTYIKYFNGNKLLLVNPEEDFADRKADIVVHEPVSDFLKRAVSWF